MTPLVLGTSTRQQHWRNPPTQVSAPAPAPVYHSLCLGITGAGKSRLLASVFLQHHLAGRAVGLIDPHGDLSSLILRILADRGDLDHAAAGDRLLYLPFSATQTPAMNVLVQPHLTAHDIALSTLDALVRVWPDLEEAPLLRTLFLSSVLALIESGLPLTQLPTLLLDPEARHRALGRVRDPLVQQTFAHFDAVSRGRPAMASSTLRRLFLLSFSPLLRTTLGLPGNDLAVRQRMDAGQSVIVDLGGVPDPVSRRLLGALVLAQIEQAALSRATLPEKARTPWLCLVDEWPVVASRHPGTLASLLDQARKYGLSLWLAGQHTSQFGSARLTGALENCRLRILFRLGADSARAMAPHLPAVISDPGSSPTRQRAEMVLQLQRLPNRHALVALGTGAAEEIRTLDVPDPAGPVEALQKAIAALAAPHLHPVVAGDPLGATMVPTATPPFDTLGDDHDNITPHDIEDWSTPVGEGAPLPSHGARRRDR